MLILAIYGKNEKDINYQLTKNIILKFKDAKVKEIFLPEDMSKPCLGCYACYNGSEKNCYAYSKLYKIYEYMSEADLIVISCPTFCDNMPGYYKSFLDHFAFMWMSRRPNRIMFSKKAIIVSTGDKTNAKSTIKELKKNLSWWGISNFFTYNNYASKVDFNVIKKVSLKTYHKVCKNKGKVSLLTKLRFYKSKHLLNKKDTYNYNYWKEEGFFNGKTPWSK